MTAEQQAKSGILICGHGSSDGLSQLEFVDCVAQVAKRFPQLPCVAASLEAQQPDLPTAARQLIEQGVTRMLVLPAMLMAGRHSQRDIPLQLAELSESADIEYLWQVIQHPKLVRAAAARVQEALQHEADHSRFHLLHIAHGSRHDAGNQLMIEQGQRIHALTACSGLSTAFGQLGQPLLETTLQTLLSEKQQQQQHLVALPYFLFNGKPLQRSLSVLEDYQQQHPQCTVITAGHLGNHPLVIEAFCDTLQHALQIRE